MNDKRHDVSNRILDTLKKDMYEQDHYGMDKYKEPLHHSYNYDWMKMFRQEMADGLKYIQNEMDRKEEVIDTLNLIKHYLEDETHNISAINTLVKHALALLTAGGLEDKSQNTNIPHEKKPEYMDLDD